MERTRSRKGFTLIELLVVMSIIATLAGLAIVGLPYYMRQVQKTKCESNLHQIYSLLLMYQTNHDAMPEASGSRFVLAPWGDFYDKNPKEAEVFFCPATKNKPNADLSNVTPEGIDYTGPEQSSMGRGRNRLSTSMAGASEIPVVCDKLPNPGDVKSASDRRLNLPHSGKGFYVLYLNGSTEFFESSRFADDLPVIGPESPIEKLRTLRQGIDG